jgi:hypothetical protein
MITRENNIVAVNKYRTLKKKIKKKGSELTQVSIKNV